MVRVTHPNTAAVHNTELPQTEGRKKNSCVFLIGHTRDIKHTACSQSQDRIARFTFLPDRLEGWRCHKDSDKL